jgi:hypothetical protein
MSLRTWFVLVAWLFSLAAVAALAQQSPRPLDPLEQPTIISGPDLGFRVEGHSGKVPVGRLVIRVNGRWVEPAPPRPEVQPAAR